MASRNGHFHLRTLWLAVRSSFWFVPALMVLAAGVLAGVFVHLDSAFSFGLAAKFPRIFGATSEGARTILATIAGSMITVSGVTFSITIVALSLAANQYSPRILRNFMADRGNQLVLGVFVSVFTYCVIVLRTIRGGEEEFIPSYALVAGIVFALVAIGFLIYFVHHIATMIQASTILAKIHYETLAVLDSLNEQNSELEETSTDKIPDSDAESVVVAAGGTGFIQDIDDPALMGWAAEHDRVIKMLRGIGEFVVDGEPVLRIYGKGISSAERVPDFKQHYSIGTSRTIEQDPAFGIRQIVDIALKALSPGINDTATAESCIEYLGAILYHAAGLRFPGLRRCCGGRLRVLARGADFTFLVDEAFHQIRQNAASNTAVYLRLVKTIGRLASATKREEQRQTLSKHLRLVGETVREHIGIAHDREVFDAEIAEAHDLLQMWRESPKAG